MDKKRPANPLSRGHSPDNKRSRSSAQSDRPVLGRSSTDPKSHHHQPSQYGPSRAAIDQPSRPNQHSPLQTGYASSHGSRASTPTQLAPTAPSMLPATAQESRTPEDAIGTVVPASLASLNLLRKKKLAMARAYPPPNANPQPIASTQALQAQLKAAQMEISALRRQMRHLETLPSQITELKERLDKAPTDDSGSMQTVMRRLEALEKSELTVDKDSPTLAKAVPGRLDKLASTMSEHQKQVEDILGWMDEQRPISNSLPGLKKDFEDARSQVRGLVNTPQVSSISRQQVESLIDNSRKLLQAEAREAMVQLTKTVEENHKIAQQLVPKVSTCLNFKVDLEERNLLLQVQTLNAKIECQSQSSLDLERRSNDAKKNIRHLSQKCDESKEALTATDWEVSALSHKIKDYPTMVGQIGALQRAQNANTNDYKRLAGQNEELEKTLNKLCKTYENLYEERMKLENRMLKVHENRLDQLDHNIKSIRQTLEEASKSEPAFVAQLRDRLSRLEQDLATAITPQSRLDQQNQQADILPNVGSQLQTDIKDIQNRVFKLESLIGTTSTVSLSNRLNWNRTEFDALKANVEQMKTVQTSFNTELQDTHGGIESMQETINSLDEEVCKHRSDIEALESNISTIFKEQFDPLQAHIDHQISIVKDSFGTLNDEVMDIKRQTDHLNTVEETLTLLKESIGQIQDSIAAETDTRKDAVAYVQTHTMQDHKPSHQQFSVLEDLARDMTLVKQDVAHLQNVTNTESTRRDSEIQAVKNHLAIKLDITTAERAMDAIKLGVRNLQDQYNNISTDDLYQRMAGWFLEQYPSDTANLLRRTLAIEQEVARVSGYCRQVAWIHPHAESLVLLVQKQNEQSTNLPASDSDLQKMSTKATEALDEARSARARSEAADKKVIAFGASVEALRSQIADLANEDRNARAEFVSKASIEHQQRVTAETKTKELIHQLRQQKDALEGSLGDLRSKWLQLSKDFHQVDDTYIKPNARYLAYLHELFVAVMQTQQVIEDVNRKLPNGRLQIKWAHDLNAGPEADAPDKAKAKAL